jgi:Zn-dependent M28 family amino/carboxypeptidase
VARYKRILAIVIVAVMILISGAWWAVTQPFVSPRPFHPPSIDAARLAQDVRILSQRYFPRSYGSDSLTAAADYIRAQLKLSSANVSDQTFEVAGRQYSNIIARFGPAQARLLVIGAHYDSFGEPLRAEGYAKGFDDYTHTPGADDNASGVAGLLELARLLAKQPPSVPVELVAYTLEEPPYFATDAMGSVRHARALHAAGTPVALMISLEMIGYFSDEAHSQSYPVPGTGLLYPRRGNYIGIVARLRDWKLTRRLKAIMRGASDLPVCSINFLPQLPGIDYSDHASYWREGYPAVMITDMGFYRNRQYHRSGDTADRLDYARMAKVLQGVYEVIRHYQDH